MATHLRCPGYFECAKEGDISLRCVAGRQDLCFHSVEGLYCVAFGACIRLGKAAQKTRGT